MNDEKKLIEQNIILVQTLNEINSYTKIISKENISSALAIQKIILKGTYKLSNFMEDEKSIRMVGELKALEEVLNILEKLKNGR